MKTILVTNRKGGVGKTTTSVNLASILATKGYKILVLDLDTQGHIQIGFGYTRSFSIGIHKSIQKGKFSKKSILQTAFDNIDFIPADVNFDIVDLANSDDGLKPIIKKIKKKYNYDFCIIDTPPTSDVLLNNALCVSDYALIPMQSEYLGLVGVLHFLRLFYKHSVGVGSNIELLGVIPTMYNKSMSEHKDILTKLTYEIGENRVLPAIRKDIKLSLAFSEGMPIVQYSPRSRGAEDYRVLVSHILDIIKDK